MTNLPVRGERRWGEQRGIGPLARIAGWVRRISGGRGSSLADRLPDLPVALRRAPLAVPYLEATGRADHRRAAVAASGAAEQAVAQRAWWAADAWAHRALWHFERADQALAATREARRIGDIRVAGGDPTSARRYYAEAISEARDIGAEREEGLASLGLGRAELELGHVTVARRLAAIAEELLVRARAPSDETAAARELRGEQVRVTPESDQDSGQREG